MKLNLSTLDGLFTIHRFSPTDNVGKQVLESAFFSICKTEDELSIVCPSVLELESPVSETGWACIKVLGPLDFSLTGILADISSILARVEISIFAISTFDTDYILIKSDKLDEAKTVLKKAGHNFNN